MKPLNNRQNDWFFDKLEARADKMLENPGRSALKVALAAITLWVLIFLFVVAVITGAVLLVLSFV